MKIEKHWYRHKKTLSVWPNHESNSDEKPADGGYWQSLKTMVHCSPPGARPSHQDCFDENDIEIQTLLEEKHQLHQAYLSDPSSDTKKDAYDSKRREVQKKLRVMQDTWLSNKVDEIQGCADRHDMKSFYNSLKCECGPPTLGSSPMLNADGATLITDRKEIVERWAEHFSDVLNCPSSINDEAIQYLLQVDMNPDVDIPPCEDEVDKELKHISSGKALGPDAISAEVFKSDGPSLFQKLMAKVISLRFHKILVAMVIFEYESTNNKKNIVEHLLYFHGTLILQKFKKHELFLRISIFH